MIVLGIETSCDDTAASVIKDDIVLSEIISTQMEHGNWGGVVPEIASRAHLRNIVPVVNRAIDEAEITKKELDAVAVTCGPGLVGALLVGLNFARGLSDSLNIPLIGINHLQAHAWAVEIESRPIETPFIILLVSGGHTSLALVKGFSEYRILGQTLDDAAGEVLDKLGRFIGLTYPCGAEIEKIAQDGNPTAVDLPRGMKSSGNLNFSFSGLKTAGRVFLEKNPEYLKSPKSADFLASLQEAVLEILVIKTITAVKNTGVNRIVLGGGVAANNRLRKMFKEMPGIKLLAPQPERCTDNGTMIANLGFKILRNGYNHKRIASANPDLQLEDNI